MRSHLVPQDDIDTVIGELLMLHHTGGRQGATAAELVLSLGGKGQPFSRDRVENALWSAPADAADVLDLERNGHRIWTPSDQYAHTRNGAAPC